MTIESKAHERYAVLAVLALLASCGSGDAADPSASSGGTQVQALPTIAFSPSGVSVAVGGTVTWVFGSVGHTVTFDSISGAPADIPGPTSNAAVSRTFATAGTYTYHCSIHSSMTGFVVVGNSTTPPPPPPPPPPTYVKTP